MEERIAFIQEKISALGIEITQKQAEQFYQYYELLIEWNQKMNLTAITDFEDVVQKHFVDSLSILTKVDLSEVETLIDVGTGAGFPGLPLKIVFPHLKVTLLDSLNKRIQFLDEVIRSLGITDIETLHGRAENYARQGAKREYYDLCVSRAVAHLSTLSEYCLPFVKIGGRFCSYKSGQMAEELADAKSAIFLLGGKIENVAEFILPDSDISRSLVCIRKVNGCPRKYPRKSGVPSRSPLGDRISPHKDTD